MTAVDWLLDSDPSLRWQVMRDLTGASAEEVAAERARIAGRAWAHSSSPCRRLLEHERTGAFPTWWHYDVLRGLEYLRGARVTPDERAAEAIAVLKSKRDGDGRWPLETRHPGTMAFEIDAGEIDAGEIDAGEIDAGEGRPSRWNTLRAMRVLRWYEGGEDESLHYR